MTIISKELGITGLELKRITMDIEQIFRERFNPNTVTSITILGTQWFRKSAGHTIQAATIFITYEGGSYQWLKSAPECGYGSDWIQSACRELAAFFLIAATDRPSGDVAWLERNFPNSKNELQMRAVKNKKDL